MHAEAVDDGGGPGVLPTDDGARSFVPTGGAPSGVPEQETAALHRQPQGGGSPAVGAAVSQSTAKHQIGGM